jgi:hypothetical protein
MEHLGVEWHDVESGDQCCGEKQILAGCSIVGPDDHDREGPDWDSHDQDFSLCFGGLRDCQGWGTRQMQPQPQRLCGW